MSETGHALYSSASSGRRAPSPLEVRRFISGASREELAVAVGLSSRQLARLERGLCRPTRATAEVLARVLGTSADALFSSIYMSGADRSDPRPTKTADVTGRREE